MPLEKRLKPEHACSDLLRHINQIIWGITATTNFQQIFFPNKSFRVWTENKWTFASQTIQPISKDILIMVMVNSHTQPRVCLKNYESIINSPINPITVSALHDAQHIHVTCYILIGKQTVSLLFSFWSDFEQWKSLGYAKTVFVVGFGDSRAFRHMESWRSHTSHAGTQRHIYHCAKGQMLMVISHPILASRAVTLSCWLSPTLLMTKLLPILPQNPQHSVAATPWGSCGLTRRKNMEEGGEASRCEWESVAKAQDQEPTCGIHTPWYAMLPLHGTHAPWAHVHASTQATVSSDVGGGRALDGSGRALSRCPCLQSSR